MSCVTIYVSKNDKDEFGGLVMQDTLKNVSKSVTLWGLLKR